MERNGALTRDSATRKVMKTLGQGSTSLPFTSDDGTKPLVVALPHEHISEVVHRVVSIGGQANVAVAFANDFALLTLANSDDVALDEVVINTDLSMGMFLIKIKENPGKSVRFRFRNINAEIPEVRQELAYA